MKIAIPRERRAHESRVSATPDTVKRFVKMGVEVSVESGAGEKAAILDKAYIDAGAKVYPTREETFSGAVIILKVQRPRTTSDGGADGLSEYPDGSILIALHNPFGDPIGIEHYAKKSIISFAMEFLPRISRAQSMDVLRLLKVSGITPKRSIRVVLFMNEDNGIRNNIDTSFFICILF